jgi:hypothetical protein
MVTMAEPVKTHFLWRPQLRVYNIFDDVISYTM